MQPLHWAASEGSLPHAATLLRYGANMEGTDGAGCTALLLAAQYGHVDMVAFLLQRGANGRAVDLNRDSALHWAAYKGSIQVCGHLLYRKELNWTTTDSYGQTPIHLAAIRGNTEVVRYLLHQGTEQDVKFVLNLPDKNGKTPLDLAIKKEKPTVELVLRETMEKHDKWGKKTRSIVVQLFSYHSWKIWMGCSTSHDVDVSPKFPLYFMVTHMILYTLWYPFIFTPIFNTSNGVLWDFSMLHASNILVIILFFYFHNKTRTTDPGSLDDNNPETSKFRKKYEETIELLSDESTLVNADVSVSGMKTQYIL
jgi:palmitoyltransferase ZDHHC13/17